MMRHPEEQNLTALLSAARDRDAASVANLWRELTPPEQEDVILALLGLQTDLSSEGIAVDPDERPDLLMRRMDEAPPPEQPDHTELIPKLVEDLPEQPDHTELIPKLVEDLRGLTAESEDVGGSLPAPGAPTGSIGYWSRWAQRWKWSALAAAWLVTTIFLFTGDVSAFGPMEWVVAILGTVVGGGLLVGTLVNFAVAAIPRRASAN